MCRFIRVWGQGPLWFLLIVCGCAAPTGEPAAEPFRADETVTSELRAAWIREVQRAAGPDYTIARTHAGDLEARHPKQNLRARFRTDGIELADRDGRAPLRMTLTRINDEDAGAGTLRHEGNRVNIERPGIEEWYVHGPLGLEQGFTIAAPLPPQEASSLRLEMQVVGDYTPMTRGEAIVWRSPKRTLETRELYAFDAGGARLPASMKAIGDTLTIEVDVAGARYPIEIDPIWMEQQKLIASDATALGWFGHSVSVAGSTAVIGMPRDAELGLDSGSAYVFVRNVTSWEQQQKLLPADGAAGDQFGISVSLDGDSVIVGAHQDDDDGAQSGSAYVFTRSGTLWTEQQKLVATDGAADDQFGYSVSLSGDSAVIGARYEADNGARAGSAYTFIRTGSVWSQEQKLLAPDGGRDDRFGSAVSMSGDTLVVGAFQDDDRGTDAGAAYVFVRSGGIWTRQQKLTASDGASVDRFGFSVFLSGDTTVLGAPLDDDRGVDAGAAYVFVRSGAVWSEQQKLVASDGDPSDQFGYSVSAAGDSVAVGARWDDDNGFNGGAAYIFVRSGSVWSEQQKVHGSSGSPSENFGTSVGISGDALLGGAPLGYRPGISYMYERVGSVWSAEAKIYPDTPGTSDEYFGSSVSISGDTAVIGAPYYDDGPLGDSGNAYVFVRSGASWIERQELRSADLAAGDQLGSAVAISGNTLVLGARWDDDNGSSSGSAYVFTRSGSAWTQQQKLVASDGAGGDWFGSAVSISGDTVTVGAPLNDGAGGNAGAAYVYVRNGSVWSEQRKLVASDAAAGDQLGTSVAVSGDTAIVGAVLDDDGGTDSGSAYVFLRSGSLWTQQRKLVPLDVAPDDRFGSAVAVSGDTVLVGARWDDDNGPDAGSAYVFTRSGGIWSEQRELFSGDGGNSQWFGSAVSLDGDTAVIGAWNDDDYGVESGSSYVFVRRGSDWAEQGKLLAPDGEAGDRFGWAVAVSGDTALIGARHDDDRGPTAGAAYAFTLMFENGEACSFDDECVSGLCDPANLVCVCDGANDCLAGEVCDSSEDPNACEPADSCGNGVVEAGEACDDGGIEPGDGCSATCFVDELPNGSECGAQGSAACASGLCDITESPPICEAAATCGNGVLERDEACDDGNLRRGDGCSTACFFDDLPVGGDCSTERALACRSGVCDSTETPPTCEVAATCGNGTVEDGEVCDDGNELGGDGCTSRCTLENDWRGGGGCSIRGASSPSSVTWLLMLFVFASMRGGRGRDGRRSR